MQIPFNTPLGFIGLIMLVLGLFLLLAGLSIINVEKITVKPGKNTWVIGIVFSALGMLLVFYGDVNRSAEKSGGTVSTPVPTLAASPLVDTPTVAPSPSSSQFEDKYALLTDASKWPLTESESFDDSDPAWLIFGNQEDGSVRHSQRIEDGRLFWGIEVFSPDIWYWQASPYYSYRDFYLSFKFKRNLGAENYTYYGLLFRKQGKKYYTFRIDDQQRYAVQFNDSGEWTDIIGWTKTPEIEPGKYNELIVIADGSNLTFYINKIYIADVSDDSLDNGEIGFSIGINGASPEIVFEFDDFELREKP